MSARHVHLRHIELHNQNLFLIGAGFCQDFSRRSSDKTLTPEFDAIARQLLTTNPVRHDDVASVGYCVSALNGFPRGMLLVPVCGLFRWMPADRGRIKQNLRALHCGKARRLRIPLVPANQRANFAIACLPGAKADISRSEIKFFVVKGVVRNVHLPVLSEQRTVGVYDDGGIVIYSGSSLFEE